MMRSVNSGNVNFYLQLAVILQGFPREYKGKLETMSAYEAFNLFHTYVWEKYVDYENRNHIEPIHVVKADKIDDPLVTIALKLNEIIDRLNDLND